MNANVNQYLRSYQREGVEWLWKQYAAGKGGILGDEMVRSHPALAYATATVEAHATPTFVKPSRLSTACRGWGKLFKLQPSCQR